MNIDAITAIDFRVEGHATVHVGRSTFNFEGDDVETLRAPFSRRREPIDPASPGPEPGPSGPTGDGKTDPRHSVKYADGSSATSNGPDPLPLTSPDGSPAIEVNGEPTGKPTPAS